MLKVVRWAPDGKSVYALGMRRPTKFGMVRYKSKKAFSPERKDWGKGKFVTDTSRADEGRDRLRHLAGRQADGGGGQLRQPDRSSSTSASRRTSCSPTPSRWACTACKATWRSDGKEVAVVQADELCKQSNGQIVRLPVANPGAQQRIGFIGDNPAFQPLTLE